LKTLTEYQEALSKVLAYRATPEFTRKVLSGLGLEWRAEPTWGLPLRVRDDGPTNTNNLYSLVDADEQLLLAFETLDVVGIAHLQRILSAANAELSRLDPASAPLIYRHSSD
jgi:hypothetical protein